MPKKKKDRRFLAGFTTGATVCLLCEMALFWSVAAWLCGRRDRKSE